MRRHGIFQVTLGQARDHLVHELDLLGAKGVVISSDIPTRRDGLPMASAAEPKDPGVAIYFERMVAGEWRPFVLACDAFRKVHWNMRAVGLTVGALRSIQRYGATEMLEQAFTGFAALPPAGRLTPWWEVLGVEPNADEATIRKAYRELAAIHHPDKGGDIVRMSEINVAFHLAMKPHGGL